MNHFVLNLMSHDVATLFVAIQDIFLDYGDQFHNNGLLGPYVLGSIARIFGFLDECDEETKDKEWG